MKSQLRNRRVTPLAGIAVSLQFGDDAVHLPGIQAHDSVTLCGFCWPTGCTVTETDEIATCRGCLGALESTLAIARCRRLRFNAGPRAGAPRRKVSPAPKLGRG